MLLNAFLPGKESALSDGYCKQSYRVSAPQTGTDTILYTQDKAYLYEPTQQYHAVIGTLAQQKNAQTANLRLLTPIDSAFLSPIVKLVITSPYHI